MKKIILCSSTLILIICIVGIILKYKKETNIFELNDNKLLTIEVNNIISVRMIEETEGGFLYYKTDNIHIIHNIYNALNNIRIGREADINVLDCSREYIFDINNGIQKIYSFHSNFYYNNHITYETENYNELKKIEIPKTDNWNK
ncbi:MAG: hypothetical protein Q4G05_00205 [Clostridia bacterium]|nr:hypothetical protein [Clostridia bacterium]